MTEHRFKLESKSKNSDVRNNKNLKSIMRKVLLMININGENYIGKINFISYNY